MFVLKGEDVHLNVTKAVVLGDLDSFFWKCNKSSIVKFTSNTKKDSANYDGRLEFPVKNYSVILKTLQVADSGDYTAVVERDKTENVAEYNVKVQGRFVNLSNTDRVAVVLFPKLSTCFFPPQIECLSLSSQWTLSLIAVPPVASL